MKIDPAPFAFLAALVFLLVISSPASAQVAGSVTLSNDVRFRGRSITDGDPALTVDLGYDHRSGIYIAASATAAISDEGPDIANIQGNIGFAHRFGSGPTIDLGVVRSDYPDYYGPDHYGGDRESAHFTEIYAGVQTSLFAAYLRYSPDYFRPNTDTLYGEVNAVFEPAPQWRLIVHAGALVQLAVPTPDSGQIDYDWKLGLVREAGAFEFQLAVSGGGPEPDYRDGRRYDRTAVTASLTWNL